MTRLIRFCTSHLALRLRRLFRPELDLHLPGRVLRVDLRDRIIATLLYLQVDYELETGRLIRAMDIEGGVAVDIGANIGLHTTTMSGAAGPRGKVFAFEPDSRNFSLLTRNLTRNQCANTAAIQAAVGAREGVCRLALNPVNFGDHRVVREPSPDRRQVEVPMTTIDESLRDVPSGMVRLIKMDVQGYESIVVEGMAETLRRNPDVVLIVEIYPEGLQEAGSSGSALVRRLQDLGFHGWEFNDFRILPVQEPWTYDLIRGGQYVDAVFCKDAQRLTRLLTRAYGPLPANSLTRAAV